MNLILNHPAWLRSCEECHKWIYEDDGQIMRRPARIGLPVLRPPGTVTPCWKCPKIPSDAPERSHKYAIEVNSLTWAVFNHYLECRAIGNFPDDPIVRKNARIIRQLMDRYEQQPIIDLIQMVKRKSN